MVNLHDPSTYHFYYGDETGSPGTILTFFPWTTARQAGAVSAKPTRPPSASRCAQSPIGPSASLKREFPLGAGERFGEPALSLTGSDGTALALVGVAGAENEPGSRNGETPSGPDRCVRLPRGRP
jgi:glyoxalase family protein